MTGISRFDSTVEGMVSLQSGNGKHAWWAVAQAVESIKATFPEAYEAMEAHFNQRLGVKDDKAKPSAGAATPSDAAGKKPASAGTPRTNRQAPKRARRGTV